MPRIAHLALAALLLPAIAGAQPLPVDDLPPELRPWVAWVLDEARDAGCPRVRDRAVCLWPGRLGLDLGASGGRFELAVHADRDTELRLPGDATRWPQEVRVDGRAAPVFPRRDTPAVRLGAGAHRVEGRFAWSRLPESLPVPAELGLLALTVEGRPVAAPRREASGLVWLRRGDAEEGGTGESLRLQVFRRLEDGIPLQVETRLQLEVSGRAREVALSGALPDAAIPLSVSGDLPARLDEERRLHVQVRGGRFEVRVRSRLESSPEAVAPPETLEVSEENASWPEREVWVFAAAERLRQVDVAGGAAVDPSRTELPAEWQALPAYLLGPEDELTLTERRRGQPQPPPDHLRLSRELWLDPSGAAYSVRDHFDGELGESTRLDLLAPGALGRVELDGTPQLVTGSGDAEAGVELRRRALQLVADSRLPRSGPLRAVGWSADVDTLAALLHVPPGWTLLGASGVDGVPGTWGSRWNLMSFFFVLLTAYAAHRLMGPRTALLAAAALVLAHGEPDAPWLVWLSLLAATALRRAVPEGRLGSLARVWWLASAALLLVLLVPFTVTQIRIALFPQTERPGVAPSGGIAGIAADQPMLSQPSRAPAVQAPAEPEVERLGRAGLEAQQELAVPAAPPPPLPAAAAQPFGFNTALAQEPQAVLQTGPGIPTWQWRSYSLSWSGPVDRDHRVRLWLVSPWLARLLTLLRLGLLGLLAARLLAWPGTPRWPRLGPAAAAALMLVGMPTPARAQAPGPDLLEELKRRLTRAAACEPDCVATPRLALRLRDGRLGLDAEVHAAATGSWSVPGPMESWTPSSVRVDGAATGALVRLEDGFLRVRLGPGVHRVEVSGPEPAADSFTLQFADRPRRARLDAPGWDAVGFREDGPPDASVQLARRLRPGSAAREAEGAYPPWLEITRTLQLGVSWTVTTQVRRVSPPGTPIAIRVPLLAGESPTDPGLEADEGQVAVSLRRDQSATAWSSTLERADALRLEAPVGSAWSEVWRLQCSAIWACQPSGLDPIARWDGGFLEPEFRPWPGEALDVALAHPEGIAGPSLTVDAVSLVATPGVRLETARLDVQVRSSREQPLELGLPEGAELQQLLLDGSSRDARPDAEGRLRVSVPAGRHALQVAWQGGTGLRLVHGLPRVALPDPAVDATLTLELPRDRWLLFTWGPAWGPAVLFWGYLLFVLAAAVVLSRLPGSPLRRGEWLLLGLGLSQVGAIGALLVAGFLFALARRGRRPPGRALAFDALQLLLVAWALVSLGLLYQAVQTGLLFRPDMQVAGNGSSDTALRWYADRLAGATPSAGAVSAPLWLYRGLMLLWALWLATSLVRWTGWAWRAFGEGGLWRSLSLPGWLRLRRRGGEPEAPPETSATEGKATEDETSG